MILKVFILAEKVFTKNFILMFLSNFLICVGFYMLMPILPIYAVKDLGIGNDSVGLIVGIFAFSAVLVRPFTGILTDNLGRMAIFIPSLVVITICSAGYAFAVGFVYLLIVRVFHGISWSGVTTANSAIVADIVPASVRGQGMGYFGLSMTIAMALGPAFGVYLIERLDFFTVFLFCGAISLISLFIAAFVKPPAVSIHPKPFSFLGLFEKRVFGVSVIQFFYAFSSSSVMTFAILHGVQEGIEGVGYFFIVFALVVSIVRFFGGKILDKRGPALFIYFGHFAYMAGCVVLAFSKTVFPFLMSGVLTGLGAGLIIPTLMTMMVNLVPSDRRGAASATVFSALDIGVGIGAVVMGIVAQFTGYFGMYLFAAAVLLIPVLWFKFYEHKHYNRVYAVMKKSKRL